MTTRAVIDFTMTETVGGLFGLFFLEVSNEEIYQDAPGVV